MAGISRTSMQTETMTPLVPPRVEFRLILDHSGHFGMFQSILAKIEDLAGMSFELFFP